MENILHPQDEFLQFTLRSTSSQARIAYSKAIQIEDIMMFVCTCATRTFWEYYFTRIPWKVPRRRKTIHRARTNLESEHVREKLAMGVKKKDWLN